MTVGLSWVAGLCDEGHYCPSGSSSPTQVVCTMGYYCPTGKYPATLYLICALKID